MSSDLEGAVKKAIDKSKPRNFTQSIDMIINLKDVDLSNPDNRVKKEVILPNGRGKKVKIGLFGEETFRMKGEDSGVDTILTKEEVTDLGDKEKKKIARENDHFIAQADIMPSIGREWGKVLGPRGKMPSPMPPTVSESELKEKIRDLRKTIRLNSGEDPVIHAPIGTENMDSKELIENSERVLESVINNFEMGETRIKTIYIKTTMGSPVEVT